MENTLIEEIDKRGNQVLSQTMKHLEYEGTIATEDYQREVELLAEEEDIVYALFINKEFKAEAHSNKDRIGIDLSEDPGSLIAINEGKNYSSEYFYEGEQVQVYDLLVPLVLNGESVGALNIGYSIDAIENSVNKMRIAIAITALIVLLIIAAVLYFVTNDK